MQEAASNASDRPAASSETARGTLRRSAGQPRDAGQHLEESPQRQVLAPEDVAPARLALFVREDVARGDVVDVCHIEHGVHGAGHPSVQVLQYICDDPEAWLKRPRRHEGRDA
jgi:hypothetical protein